MTPTYVSNVVRVKKSSRASAGRRLTNSGFTIIEVAMAGMVLALAISTSIVVLQRGLRALDTARYTTLAGQILQSQMEKLRLLSWDQMTNTTYGPVIFPTFPADIATVPTSELKRFKVGSAEARCSQVISTPAVGPGMTAEVAAKMLEIKLTATWTGMDGRPHSLSYISYYGKFGLSDFFYTSH